MYSEYAILDERRMRAARLELSHYLPEDPMSIIAGYVLGSEETERLARVIKKYSCDGHGFWLGDVKIPPREGVLWEGDQWVGIGLPGEHTLWDDVKNSVTEFSIRFGDTYNHYADDGGYVCVRFEELLPSRELKIINGLPWDSESWNECGSLLLRGKDLLLAELIREMDVLD